MLFRESATAGRMRSSQRLLWSAKNVVHLGASFANDDLWMHILTWFAYFAHCIYMTWVYPQRFKKFVDRHADIYVAKTSFNKDCKDQASSVTRTNHQEYPHASL